MPATLQFALDFTAKLPPPAQARINDGMAQADQNADLRWRHIFDACVLAASRKQPQITSDDVLAEIEALPQPPSTHNLAAIGPAMKRAAQMGILRRTGRLTRSKRPEKNGNLHAVWECVQFSSQLSVISSQLKPDGAAAFMPLNTDPQKDGL